MKKLLLAAFSTFAFALSYLPSTANATVITFDNLSGNGTLASNYAGLTWGSGWMYYDSNQSPYNAFSGKERIYNYNSGKSFKFANDVVFTGAYFAGYNSISFDLFNDGQLVDTTSSINLSAAPTFLSTNYTGAVDEVRVNGTGGYFVMDNVTFAPANIPEPASLALLGMGLAGLVASRRRKA